jgi:hypothetical protein
MTLSRSRKYWNLMRGRDLGSSQWNDLQQHGDLIFQWWVSLPKFLQPTPFRFGLGNPAFSSGVTPADKARVGSLALSHTLCQTASAHKNLGFYYHCSCTDCFINIFWFFSYCHSLSQLQWIATMMIAGGHIHARRVRLGKAGPYEEDISHLRLR